MPHHAAKRLGDDVLFLRTVILNSISLISIVLEVNLIMCSRQNVKEEYKGKKRTLFLAFPLDNVWYLATKYQSKRPDKPETFEITLLMITSILYLSRGCFYNCTFSLSLWIQVYISTIFLRLKAGQRFFN